MQRNLSGIKQTTPLAEDGEMLLVQEDGYWEPDSRQTQLDAHGTTLLRTT